MEYIVVRGARQHNLKDITVRIPRNLLVVCTGLSGSGKSSLAFDTIFAEGYRRYLDALSTHSRTFLQQFDAPDVDSIDGLSPTIAVRQGVYQRNPRSTVGTLSEIYDYLRILFARAGIVYCPECHQPVQPYTIAEMVKEILEQNPPGSRLIILTPLGKVSRKNFVAISKKLRRDGFTRIRLDGEIFELDSLPALPPKTFYQVDLIVDRLVVNLERTNRLRDSLELAVRVGSGWVGVQRAGESELRLFSETSKCIQCGRTFSELSPSLFSFNNPHGACPGCKGLGVEMGGSRSDLDYSLPCVQCGGARLNETARSVKLGGLTIQEVCDFELHELGDWLISLPLRASLRGLLDKPVSEIIRRLNTMEELRLNHLKLSRSVLSLSGGELQRIYLTRQINTSLSGILFVLDEPSVGLHPADLKHLINLLARLRHAGNTVLVVEHDRDLILESDYVLEMGPGAGINGGKVVFAGSPRELLTHTASLTGQYLSGQKRISLTSRRKPFSSGTVRLVGARGHNLKGITVAFPIACMICVTGISGSGKTTLVIDTLYKGLITKLHGGSKVRPEPFDIIENGEVFQAVSLIDQSPLGKITRSTPATYTGVFASVRKLFSQLPEARARGYGSERFSFNLKGGRCETCKGEGFQSIEMFFMPDAQLTCSVCKGSRFNRETLEIKYKGYSVADILQMTVTEALAFFENIPEIAHKLGILNEVGLGYLQLGQSAKTLSGGEAQRVKLAAELARRNSGKTLYVLDEPTTGLHFDDIQKLLYLLSRLVDQGNTVIMIEHHPDVIFNADYVIDLGPEGGDGGGHLIVAGTPYEVAKHGTSHTGKYLRSFFTNLSPAPQ